VGVGRCGDTDCSCPAPPIGEIVIERVCKVVGTTFKNQDGTSRQEPLCRIYDDFWTEDREDEIEVELRREPDNPHDQNAVAVWIKKPKQAKGQVGFVPAVRAEYVSELIRSRRLVSARIEDMGCTSGGARVWLKIAIKFRDSRDEPEEDEEEDEYLLDDHGED